MANPVDDPEVEVLFDFRVSEATRRWAALDDRVMGGVSRSELAPGETGTALFRGRLSLERGGGFASVRSSPAPSDLGGRAGIALRHRGDGRSYKLRLRTEASLDGVTYQAAFPTTAGVWETTRLPFERFRASFRGRPVPEADPLDPKRIMTFGLLVGDGQAGEFELELAWIGAFDA